jgi:hypothetical protein
MPALSRRRRSKAQPRLRKDFSMQHHPIGSFDWKRIVKRAELPRTTKLIAGFMGDFANADGTGVRPGVELLAKMAASPAGR